MARKKSKTIEKNRVRFGIIGLGVMGGGHADAFRKGQTPRATLAAVCDIDPARLAPYEGLPAFTDSRELIRSGTVDAVLIAPPHYAHTTIGIDALRNGLHTLVEKPISVHKADAERLIAAAKANPKPVFGAMFQQRTEAAYIKARELMRSGELGELQRLSWIITSWFRSEAYYASGGWRATWAGEGGGVLLNQCPHNLDLLQWIAGMPVRMRATCHFGRYHDIEVEDDVTAYFEYANGASGTFITTTGEAPGTNRLEITGTRGKLLVEGGKVLFTRNVQPIDVYNRETDSMFGRPEVWKIEIPLRGGGGGHNGIRTNFVNAILDGTELMAPAVEGIHSVELANAMLMSTFTNRTVELPLSGPAYWRHLKKRCATSRYLKKAKQTKAPVKVDFAASLNTP